MYVCVSDMHRGQKRGTAPVELECHTVVSSPLGTRKESWVLLAAEVSLQESWSLFERGSYLVSLTGLELPT